MQNRYFYKIRRVSDGLYSMGGIIPKFIKSGKVWNSIGSLKNHFKLIEEYNKIHARMYANSVNWEGMKNELPYGYKDKCEVVQFEQSIVEVGPVSMKQCEFDKYNAGNLV